MALGRFEQSPRPARVVGRLDLKELRRLGMGQERPLQRIWPAVAHHGDGLSRNGPRKGGEHRVDKSPVLHLRLGSTPLVPTAEVATPA